MLCMTYLLMDMSITIVSCHLVTDHADSYLAPFTICNSYRKLNVLSHVFGSQFHLSTCFEVVSVELSLTCSLRNRRLFWIWEVVKFFDFIRLENPEKPSKWTGIILTNIKFVSPKENLFLTLENLIKNLTWGDLGFYVCVCECVCPEHLTWLGHY